ncbi:MAG: T9SS type A sorting domain-containing protein, partial [Bacteroidia bacterium]|nr:T9SS type A sorting domain-containing protein [Bacteroidia bacterium]
PAHNKVSVELASAKSTDITIKLMDAQGRILMTDLIKNVSSTQQLSYDLSDFAKGVYFFRLSSESGISMHRLVVE